ncbi:MAG: RHS repeat protein, partial [bacterium]|nr:RHS repeat protein [bacterium]
MLETEAITGLYNRAITRTYDTEDVPGRPTGFSIGADYSVTYGYEPDTGRFGSVSWNSDASEHTAAYTYEPNSDLLHGMTVGDRFKTTYQYESERNLRTQIKNEFDSQTVSVYDYLYNEQGSRTSLETDGSAFSGGITATAQTAAYMTNSLNQYTDITTAKTPDPQITNVPEYDDDGNLTGISDDPGTLRYSYNGENRLIAAAPELPMQGDKKVEFVYDYMGRRVKKTVSVWNGSWTQETEKLFVYDGWN